MNYFKSLEKRKEEMILASTAFNGLRQEVETALSSKLLEEYRYYPLYNKKNNIYFEFHKIQVFLFVNDFIDSDTMGRDERACVRFHVRPLINEDHKYFHIIKSNVGKAVSERSKECFEINPLPYYFEFNFDYNDGFIEKILTCEYEFVVKGFQLELKKLDLQKVRELGLKI